jgi:hypothetical protein
VRINSQYHSPTALLFLLVSVLQKSKTGLLMTRELVGIASLYSKPIAKLVYNEKKVLLCLILRRGME